MKKKLIVLVLLIASIIVVSTATGVLKFYCGTMFWDTTEYPRHRQQFCRITLFTSPKVKDMNND